MRTQETSERGQEGWRDRELGGGKGVMTTPKGRVTCWESQRVGSQRDRGTVCVCVGGNSETPGDRENILGTPTSPHHCLMCCIPHATLHVHINTHTHT